MHALNEWRSWTVAGNASTSTLIAIPAGLMQRGDRNTHFEFVVQVYTTDDKIKSGRLYKE